MSTSSHFPFDDLQALLRFGHGKLTDSCFLLLTINDADAAKRWLQTAPISNAVKADHAPESAMQIAFSVLGLRKLGVTETVIQQFSDEFITGMSGNESRSRRLGDVGVNAPSCWQWGGNPEQVPDVILLIYAKKGGTPTWDQSIKSSDFSTAFQILSHLPTDDLGGMEPFGFQDGISEPVIDWERQQSTDKHQRDQYSNLLAVGEVVLGYPNEYGMYSERPLIDPGSDPYSAELPDAEEQPGLKDFGRNGSYLVVRQLSQDVPGFWQFMDKTTGSDPEQRDQLAAAMVGRQRDGTPLVNKTAEPIPGIPRSDSLNHFTFNFDPKGQQCPIGAHIRRANPRTGDFPTRVTGLFTRIKKILGFAIDDQEDLIASSRFHRILRRGRPYGPVLTPEQASKPDAPHAERGLQFMCLSGNILRQFEFVQNAWLMSTKFGGLSHESDPLLGNREPLANGAVTSHFSIPDASGPTRKVCDLPQFVTVIGGGYFFMPGLSAIRYIVALPVPANGSDQP